VHVAHGLVPVAVHTALLRKYQQGFHHFNLSAVVLLHVWPKPRLRFRALWARALPHTLPYMGLVLPMALAPLLLHVGAAAVSPTHDLNDTAALLQSHAVRPPAGGCCQISEADPTAACHEYSKGQCIKLPPPTPGHAGRQIGCNRHFWVADADFVATRGTCERPPGRRILEGVAERVVVLHLRSGGRRPGMLWGECSENSIISGHHTAGKLEEGFPMPGPDPEQGFAAGVGAEHHYGCEDKDTFHWGRQDEHMAVTHQLGPGLSEFSMKYPAWRRLVLGRGVQVFEQATQAHSVLF